MSAPDVAGQVIKTVDTTGHTKDGPFLFNKLADVIDGIGPEHVVGIVMDSAQENIRCGRMAQEKYRHIEAIPCATHITNNLFRDISKLEYWDSMITHVRTVVHFFKSHQATRAWLQHHSNLVLLAPSTTRFARHYLVVKRAMELWEVMQAIVAHPTFKAWAKKSADRRVKAARAVEALNDCIVPYRGELFVRVMGPLYKALRLFDSNKPTLSKVQLALIQNVVMKLPSRYHYPITAL